MNDTKSILKSRTFWAAIIAAAAQILTVTGVVSKDESGAIEAGAVNLIGIISTFSAIYFRKVATKEIKK